MELRKVEIGDELYNQAVELRRQFLFQELSNPEEYLNDPWEKRSVHIVASNEGKVIGYGRLTDDKEGGHIVSQVVVNPKNRKQSAGSQIVEELVKTGVFAGATQLYLSATENSIEFFEKNGFNTIGAKFTSPKTGFVHISMILKF